MASVDPNDDEVTCFGVRRYAHDVAQRERRHLVVAAFDNAREFDALIDTLIRELDQRRAAGLGVDPKNASAERLSNRVQTPTAERSAGCPRGPATHVRGQADPHRHHTDGDALTRTGCNGGLHRRCRSRSAQGCELGGVS
jgi:hypothetical protein